MKKLWLPMACAMLVSLSACDNGKNLYDSKIITLEHLLDEMVDYASAAEFPEYSVRQTSSYDRRSLSPGQPGWFANNDGSGYERIEEINGHKEKVLFETEGPGVVTRIWMTTSDKRGVLRFYFDGEQTPRFTIPAYDMSQAPFHVGEALSMRHTNYETRPDGRGGNTFMLPLPYARHCRITLEEPDWDRFIPRYYQINYRTYAPGTRIESFTTKSVEQLQDKLNAVSTILLHPEARTSGEKQQFRMALDPGEKKTISLEGENQAIYSLSFKVGDTDSENTYTRLMRGLILSMRFDGQKTVWAPLGEFAGAGIGAPEVRSWYLDCDGHGSIESRWVMPYRRTASLSLENYTDRPATVDIEVATDAYDRTPATLYFHTSWRQQRDIPLSPDYDASDNLDWNFATLYGRGVLRGDLLTLYNNAPDWYGEGDEKIWVDDDTFPSHFGTGTEDYYNCSWAPVVPFQTPFGGAPRADEPTSHGYNSFMRTRNLDAIPFHRELRFDIEMLSWHHGTADYATTVWWYGDLESRAEKNSSIDEVRAPLR